MLVQAMTSFVAIIGGQMMTVRAGEVLELPEGADWLTANLAIPFVENGEPVEIEMATLKGTEKAVTRRRKG
jgi:hypothetical protein